MDCFNVMYLLVVAPVTALSHWILMMATHQLKSLEKYTSGTGISSRVKNDQYWKSANFSRWRFQGRWRDLLKLKQAKINKYEDTFAESNSEWCHREKVVCLVA